MKTIWAEQALTDAGWMSDVAAVINADGKISSVTVGTAPQPDDHKTAVLLPAPVNAHSHAFQRAMAGLTEKRGPNPNDSFWTWRQLMYRFLDRLTPEHIQAIAAYVQLEMLEAGYATNVEFHYLHHQPGGVHYDDIAELSQRIVNATQTSGIGLTLLPVHYQYGGLDKRPLGAGQIRFENDPDHFARLYEQAARAAGTLPADCRMGLAPHSLRAVAPDEISETLSLTDGPVHMHLAEQVAEVEEVKAALGQRPVEWVLENLNPNSGYTFIHCTQMLPHETEDLARSGAVAGLCPITESNLGDGIFDGLRWFDAGGNISIGSDSNIRIALSEELRTLDYSQRLRDRSRAALASHTQSTGRRIFERMCAGGAISAGRETGSISVGRYADLIALDGTHMDLDGKRGDTVLDSYIFAGDNCMVTDVWSAGRHMVKDSQHVRRSEISAAYRAAMRDLGQNL